MGKKKHAHTPRVAQEAFPPPPPTRSHHGSLARAHALARAHTHADAQTTTHAPSLGRAGTQRWLLRSTRSAPCVRQAGPQPGSWRGSTAPTQAARAGPPRFPPGYDTHVPRSPAQHRDLYTHAPRGTALGQRSTPGCNQGPTHPTHAPTHTCPNTRTHTYSYNHVVGTHTQAHSAKRFTGVPCSTLPG
jgi:hypothetical protein